MHRLLLILCFLAVFIAPAQAQTPAISPAYQARAEQLVTQLRTPGNEEGFFAPVFIAAVPPAQWQAITENLRAQYGAVEGLSTILPQGASSGAVEIRYAKAIVGFSMVIAGEAPHLVIGLRITGAKTMGDSIPALLNDMRALPGSIALQAVRLTDSGPQSLFALNPDRSQAIGSTFKLYLLAELSRSVTAGRRAWSDTVPLSHKSFPGGRLHSWPNKAPLTLHSLATLMIAESDNSASDTLHHALGRMAVDAMVAQTGHHRPAVTLPLMTTTEAFALKMPDAKALRDQYLAADTVQRTRLLNEQAEKLGSDDVDLARVADKPVMIDTLEWFATPDDIIALLNWLRINGGEDAKAIMAVNPGIGAGDAARWAYLGYKGGSEPGVIAMSFLLRDKNGQWQALSASWNNPDAVLDNARFVALITRALNLMAQ